MSITLCGSGTQVTVPEKGCNDCGAVADNLKELETKIDEDYYDKTEVNDLLSAIKTATIQVVDELPNPGETNIIYLVPKTAAETASEEETSDIYNEYVYVNGKYEYIGTTEVPQYWTIDSDGKLTTANGAYGIETNYVNTKTVTTDVVSSGGEEGETRFYLSPDAGFHFVRAYGDGSYGCHFYVGKGVEIIKGDEHGNESRIEIFNEIDSSPTGQAIAVDCSTNNLVYSDTLSLKELMIMLGRGATSGDFLQFTNTSSSNRFAWTSLNIPRVKKFNGWLSMEKWNQSTLGSNVVETNSITIDDTLSEPNVIICRPAIESVDNYAHSAYQWYSNGIGYLSTDGKNIHFYAANAPTSDVYVEIIVLEYSNEVMTTSMSNNELGLLDSEREVQ